MAGVVSNRLRNKVIPAYYQRVMLEMVFGQSDSRQNYSSRKYEKELHDLAIKIFQCCAENQLENQISLDIQWIPRSDLERADYISRIVDIDDWQITNSCFEYIDKLWVLIPWTALQITITIKSKIFSRDSGTLILVGRTFSFRMSENSPFHG